MQQAFAHLLWTIMDLQVWSRQQTSITRPRQRFSLWDKQTSSERSTHNFIMTTQWADLRSLRPQPTNCTLDMNASCPFFFFYLGNASVFCFLGGSKNSSVDLKICQCSYHWNKSNIKLQISRRRWNNTELFETISRAQKVSTDLCGQWKTRALQRMKRNWHHHEEEQDVSSVCLQCVDFCPLWILLPKEESTTCNTILL